MPPWRGQLAVHIMTRRLKRVASATVRLVRDDGLQGR
jgi:hypothetical protein